MHFLNDLGKSPRQNDQDKSPPPPTWKNDWDKPGPLAPDPRTKTTILCTLGPLRTSWNFWTLHPNSSHPNNALPFTPDNSAR